MQRQKKQAAGFWHTATDKMVKEKTKKKQRIIKHVELPDGVSASIIDQDLIIKGVKGESKKAMRQHNVVLKVEGNKIVLETKRETKKDKKIIGSLVAHVKNMIRGSMENHIYILKICSGHFPMNVSTSNNKLIVKNFLGEKVPRILQLKEGADVKIEGEIIKVESSNKELAGQVSADIEQLTRRPGYDSRIFQDGIYITNKDGRELK